GGGVGGDLTIKKNWLACVFQNDGFYFVEWKLKFAKITHAKMKKRFMNNKTASTCSTYTCVN
uniref:Uncharacterized protein n=1 Tax=Amphimedon queenslandica TaxID=400682 RepID=A0A1X7V2P3_AMPQE